MTFPSFLRLPATLLSLAISLSIYARTIVSGRVTEYGTGDPLPGVSVRYGRTGTNTDNDGRYTLKIPNGHNREATINFCYPGYGNHSVNVPTGRNSTVNVSLHADQKLLNEIIVNGNRYDFGVKSPQMGAVAITNTQIRNMPAVFGEPDVLKTLQATPGVQSGKTGNAGIMVRGGNFDQNSLSVDGATLYSTEHMRGFVSAVNPDMISSLAFYRGAFPARYSGRLSGIIDISAAEGDFDRYHVEATAGLSIGRLFASGPIVKGRTSFSVSARMSYFDLIYQPLVQRHYDKTKQTNPYSDLGFWDVNAKITQKLSRNDKISLTFVMDEDKQKAPERTPSQSSTNLPFYIKDSKETTAYYYIPADSAYLAGTLFTNSYSQQNADNMRWGNTLGALNWHHNFDESGKTFHLTLAASSFNYRRTLKGTEQSGKEVRFRQDYPRKDSIVNEYSENSQISHRSDVLNLRMAADMHLPLNRHHNLLYGLEARHVTLNPRRDISKYISNYRNWCVIDHLGRVTVDHRDELTITDVNSTVGRKQKISTGSLFVGDEISYGKLRANVGVNLTSYIVPGKTYFSPEPRLSLSMGLWESSSVKASASRMSQGERLLSSISIVSPNDIWVPVTDSVPPMKSTLYALSLNQQAPWGIDISVEGYYKHTSGTIQYIDGTDFSNIASNWERQITIGKAKSYGVELLVQKFAGSTTGWISYTWSRSLEKYDSPGKTIDNGRWISALADRPHNLSVNVTQRFNISSYPGNFIDLSARYSYVSGRKVTIPDHISYAGMLRMADHYMQLSGASSFSDVHLGTSTFVHDTVTIPSEMFDKYMRFEGYSHRGNYSLPCDNSLDISMALNIMHPIGQSRLTIGVTNLLNHKNLSNVYLSATPSGQSYLKGVCDFPIMPSLSYTYIF